MNVSKSLLLAVVALGLPALIPSASSSQSAPIKFKRGRGLPPPTNLAGDGDGSALAIRDAARNDANAAYWIKIANCLNDPNSDLAADERQALSELHLDLAMVERQYEARLALCGILGTGPYDPQLDPNDFSPAVDQSHLPFVRGRTLVYEKKGAAGAERVEVTTLNDTRIIGGFECRAVGGREWLDGVLVQDTIDWFAQHSDGTVWYFGELSKHFEDGLLVDLDGSWMTGKNGAKPGIVMLAHPVKGDAYRQEFQVNEAEDVARVLATDETVVVPYGTFTGCVEIEEWSPLSLEGPEWNFYAPNLGLVLEINVKTGERLELVGVK